MTARSFLMELLKIGILLGWALRLAFNLVLDTAIQISRIIAKKASVFGTAESIGAGLGYGLLYIICGVAFGFLIIFTFFV